jgi:type I restriction enzyme R subunit
MTYTNPDAEDALEQETIRLFASLGWTTANCRSEVFAAKGAPPSTLGRDTSAEVVLQPRLQAAIYKLNPGITPLALQSAINELSKDRTAMSPANANKGVYGLLKDGIKVSYKRGEGDKEEEAFDTVQVIDWNEPGNNDFFLASQFRISGAYGNKRADLIGFVNGVPLVFIELKASHKRLDLAYDKNLKDYRDTIPQVFWYNAVVILSNGSKARMGSMTAGFEHFSEWKKINSEGEEGVVSLETTIRGVCDKARLLDLVENFTIFNEAKGEPQKLVAKNHQFLGVNNAIAAVEHIKDTHGKLGVFWHTQGSGKSYSMVFFSQKVLRKIPGNWTFVIVTDREDLDGQIYRNFANTGAVLEDEKRVRADSGESLKRMLNQENHRYLFTLIQKFHTEQGERYPVLSERSDIIVITDEAHRSQYDTFALNMRNALPNAAFLGFTGTPLMAGEELTKAVFGEYVSVYNFRQSVEDHNTVPLYYENRIPEVQLANDDLNEEMEAIIDAAELDENQQAKLERQFRREYQLITRDDRLEKIAEDLVDHYMGRGVLAKAMVVSIDKATAVRTYDKVQKHWKVALEKLRKGIPAARPPALPGLPRDAMIELASADPMDKPELERRLRFFEETDMAVVVSQSQGEIEEFQKKGLDIGAHRKRIVKEDLETQFKDDQDPLRIVFVCAMWITGFDVPSCSTIYLDKPLKNHTLMQTIARANRVFGEKQSGLIVDYIGVFRNLQKALAIYGSAQDGTGDLPIHDKGELVHQLREAIANTAQFCVERGFDPAAIQDTQGFERISLLDDAVAAIVVNDDSTRRYLALAGSVEKLFQSLLPDAAANEFGPTRKVFAMIAEKIRADIPPVDISAVMSDVEALLNRSIAAGGYAMPPVANEANYIDLSLVDFDALKAQFDKGRRTIEAQRLRARITQKLARMVKLNPARMDFLEEFQKVVDEYNSGAANVEAFFARLMAFTKRLNEEEKRGIAQNLTEEELALFDLLTKPDLQLTKQEEIDVKKAAKALLETLKKEKLVLDWRKRQTTRAMVRYTIETVLDQLPRAYSKELYEQKCDAVYQHFYEAYMGQGKSVYSVN